MYLKLFGGASIEGAEGPMTGRGVQRRRLALLALLAAQRQRGMSRERITAILWPEADANRARHLLSDSIYRINQSLGAEVLLAVGDELRLNPGILPSDIARFSEALERGEWARATDLYAGPFLDGVFLADTPEFDQWVDGERSRLAADFGRAIEQRAEEAERSGDTGAAVRHWRRASAHDALNARVALRYMRALDGPASESPLSSSPASAGSRWQPALELRVQREGPGHPGSRSPAGSRRRRRGECATSG